MTQRNDEQEPTPPPGQSAGGASISITDPSSKVSPMDIDPQIAEAKRAGIREGIRLERSRVIAMLFSGQWKHEPCQDAAGLIMNGMHWEELRRRVDDACR